MARPLSHRLFYALLPSPVEARRIGLQRDRVTHIGSPVTNDRLHMTLGISDDFARFPQPLADAMVTIAERASAEPLRVELDRLAASRTSVALRPGRVPPALRQLSAELVEPLERRGLARPDWSFHPHVTLAYRLGEPFNESIAPVVLDAAEFVLIHSIVGATQHIELGRWPLAVRQLALL
jgi:RNA 2',3'-cyclic 3'-phosphodiesterase